MGGLKILTALTLERQTEKKKVTGRVEVNLNKLDDTADATRALHKTSCR